MSSAWLARGVAAVALLGVLAGTTRAERRIWWCQGAAPSFVHQMNLDGAAPDVFGGLGCIAQPLAVAPQTRHLFFVESSALSKIRRVDIDPGGGFTWTDFPGNVVAGIAVDTGNNGPVYYAYNDNGLGVGTIWRRNIDGSNVALLLGTASLIRDLAHDTFGNKIYWVEDDGVHRANQDGSGPELFKAVSDGSSVAVYGAAGQLWFSRDTGGFLRWDIPTGNLTANVATSGSIKSVRADQAGRIYWYEVEPGLGRIRRMRTDLSEFQTLLELGTDPSDITQFIGLELGFFTCGDTNVFGDVTNNGSLSFADISLAVDCFRGVASCNNASFNRADLNPCNSGGCIGDGLVNFTDVSRAVDAFRNLGCI